MWALLGLKAPRRAYKRQTWQRRREGMESCRLAVEMGPGGLEMAVLSRRNGPGGELSAYRFWGRGTVDRATTSAAGLAALNLHV